MNRAQTAQGETPVTYTGRETPFTDRLYGSRLTFEPGQTREVTLVALAGKRTVYGFRQGVMGKL